MYAYKCVRKPAYDFPVAARLPPEIRPPQPVSVKLRLTSSVLCTYKNLHVQRLSFANVCAVYFSVMHVS